MERSSSLDENTLKEMCVGLPKKMNSSVSSLEDAKQDIDELPDEFEIFTEANWRNSETCDLCQKKLSMWSRHHWYSSSYL